MQRGVYFDGWFPGQHCYHPSLPPRRLKMIDDLADMRSTMLVWSALGGGSISLPYLENEAFGLIPERFRTYGFVNDSEFIAHAQARGIDVFGIVFECQGWEFPAEVVDGEVLALNETREVAPRSWLGLREFSQDTGPKDWKPFRHYFPDGLVNSLGEQVTDLWEECSCRDLAGAPLHPHWVEATDREHQAHYMDRNNPVWREYLKAIIRLQIDAGVAGIQLDESETPLGAMRYGGCFCKDCVGQFRAYLQRVLAQTSDPELMQLPLETFDYAEWLRGLGFQAGVAPRTLPLYEHYCRFQVEAVVATFKEITDYIREYSASVGRPVKAAGNFYNCFPEYDAMVTHADLLITEMRITGERQPWWFRHATAFGRGKDVVVVENPYGGVVPTMVEELNVGKSYDKFRMSIFEGAAMGADMTLPYGSWLGSEIEDSFWAPKALADECGQFLEEIDGLRSAETVNDVAVLYSVPSNMQAELDGDRWDDQGLFFDQETGATPPTAYWGVIERLSDERIPYDCVIFPDESLRPHDIFAGELKRYSTLVVADCGMLSAVQHAVLVDYLNSGGHVVLLGRYGQTLTEQERGALSTHPNVAVVASADALVAGLDRQVCSDTPGALAVNTAALAGDEVAVHVVNYEFDADRDSVVVRTDVAMSVRTARPIARAVVHRPEQAPESITVHTDGGAAAFTIPRLQTYAVVHLIPTSS